MSTPILDRENPLLRAKAKPVPSSEIGSVKINKIIKSMQEALHAEEDGVAIAAPQIGESLRIFVVNGETLAHLKKKSSDAAPESLPDQIYINPEITKRSRKKQEMEEGCLSVRWLYGHVLRSEKVTLRAQDEKGKKIEKGASGLLAQIFQHEVDHLDGILFVDKARNLENIPPSKNVASY